MSAARADPNHSRLRRVSRQPLRGHPRAGRRLDERDDLAVEAFDPPDDLVGIGRLECQARGARRRSRRTRAPRPRSHRASRASRRRCRPGRRTRHERARRAPASAVLPRSAAAWMTVEPLRVGSRPGRARVVAVAEGAGSSERRLGATPDHDRQRRLDGQRPEHEVLDRVEAASERLGRTRPQVAPQPDRLVEVGATDMEAVGGGRGSRTRARSSRCRRRR